MDSIHIRDEIKILLLKEHSSITEVAKIMSNLTGKPYTMRSLANKLKRGTLNVAEYKLIANIFGYEVEMRKTNLIQN